MICIYAYVCVCPIEFLHTEIHDLHSYAAHTLPIKLGSKKHGSSPGAQEFGTTAATKASHEAQKEEDVAVKDLLSSKDGHWSCFICNRYILTCKENVQKPIKNMNVPMIIFQKFQQITGFICLSHPTAW